MEATVLAEYVRHWFCARAAEYGLQPETLQVRYVLNWGGFVNYSFTLTDGVRACHLKLADEEPYQKGLVRWARLNATLEAQYHAPRILDEIHLPEVGFTGLLFEHIPGRTPVLAQESELLRSLLPVIQRLHTDTELAELLSAATEEESKTCFDCYREIYIERFDEDLKIIEAALPPFVDPPTLQWMQEETRRLESRAAERGAFALPTHSPVHGDLWQNNILVTDTGAWYLLDWDDLMCGDVVADYALLFWTPGQERGRGEARWQDFMSPPDSSFAERMTHYRRTLLLDEVIDVLADYVEADLAPEHTDRVREEKRQIHLNALEEYRQTYRD